MSLFECPCNLITLLFIVSGFQAIGGLFQRSMFEPSEASFTWVDTQYEKIEPAAPIESTSYWVGTGRVRRSDCLSVPSPPDSLSAASFGSRLLATCTTK